MRLLLFTFYLCSFLLDAFLNCSGSTPATPDNTMGFSVDGMAYAIKTNVYASQSADSLSVSGNAPQAPPTPSPSVYLTFPKAVGTYQLANRGAGMAVFNTGNQNSDVYYAGTKAGTVFGNGTITVDSYVGNTITGTFSFTAQHAGSGMTKTVTDGHFSCSVR
ncbi:hypothetical protein GCM10022409_21410 [Hymenobacter glaciei]|uniref:Uncharacterized protein n=1 Tax=Hymenobacter glaciei TaxID=877209 RepID=A0ABP7U521_9BACT